MTREEWEAEALKSDCRAEAERLSEWRARMVREIGDDMKEFVVPIFADPKTEDYDFDEPF